MDYTLSLLNLKCLKGPQSMRFTVHEGSLLLILLASLKTWENLNASSLLSILIKVSIMQAQAQPYEPNAIPFGVGNAATFCLSFSQLM